MGAVEHRARQKLKSFNIGILLFPEHKIQVQPWLLLKLVCSSAPCLAHLCWTFTLLLLLAWQAGRLHDHRSRNRSGVNELLIVISINARRKRRAGRLIDHSAWLLTALFVLPTRLSRRFRARTQFVHPASYGPPGFKGARSVHACAARRWKCVLDA